MPQLVAKGHRSTQARPEAKPPSLIQSADGKPELTFALESFADMARELPALMAAHHRELKTELPLRVAWQELLRLNAFGILRPLAARDRGRLIGYIGNMVRQSLWAAEVQCWIEAFYLEPTYRSGWFGFRMFKANEALLREWGVRRVFVTSEMSYKDGRAASLFERLGYRHSADVFCKSFGG